MKKQYLIQMIDGDEIVDARIYYSESSFRSAAAYEWPAEYALRCYDVTDALRPVRIWL